VGQVNTTAQTAGQDIELKSVSEIGVNQCLGLRCHSILLKLEGRTSNVVVLILY